MCGIAGIFNLTTDPVDLFALVRMTRTMVHRGPDEEGYFVNHAAGNNAGNIPIRHLPGSSQKSACNTGLGHRRLSIIDLATGQQPLCNEDGTIWICFNGEVYNFRDLIGELESRGHRFHTRSDTEAIVHAYEEWGERCVERLRGMFAFAIWDEPRQQLFIARDRLGKKPLYYLLDDRRFIFASELKAILSLPEVSRDIDYEALSDYLSLLYIPSPKTIFKSIRKLPAAHYAVVTANTCQICPYWDLNFSVRDERSETVIMDDLLGLLEESTSIRMMSEVPLGAFLSGGVDSSAVVACMARASTEPVKTNSISFSMSKYSEAEYAQRVAQLFATDHREMIVTPDAVQVIKQLAWHYDEPFADSSAVPTYYVSKATRERVTVALSGDGGDENFCGYRRYHIDMKENLVRSLFPDLIRRPLFGFLGVAYPKADYLPQMFRGKTFLSNVARDPADAYCFSMSAFKENEKRTVLDPQITNSLGGYVTADLFRELYRSAPADDHLSRIQYIDVKTYLCEDILTKVDRASMAVSLEVRCPVLDHVFMEYAAGIHSRLKLVGCEGKHIFKKALRRYLPDDILYRQKMGFSMPIVEWLRGDLRDYAASVILEGEATKHLLQPAAVERMWQQHQSGIRNRATELWALMMLNLWYDRFLGVETTR